MAHLFRVYYKAGIPGHLKRRAFANWSRTSMAIVNLKQRIALCYTLFSTLIVLDILVATSTVMFLCHTPRIFVPHENIENFQNHPNKNSSYFHFLFMPWLQNNEFQEGCHRLGWDQLSITDTGILKSTVKYGLNSEMIFLI